ncbi:hypothetical protein U1Q18_035615 [Sarracenia purpurea var. burkii]
MASESTVVSDHSTAPEQVEKLNEEIKKVEQESSFPSKSNGDEENLKAEEFPIQLPTLASEVKDKIEDKKIESFPAQEAKKTDETPISKVPVEDKSDPSVSVEKTEQVEVLPVKESETAAAKGAEDSEVEHRKEEIPKQVTEVENKQKEQSETAEKIGKEFEGVELEKTEKVEVLPVKELETVVAKGTEDSEVEPRKEEIPKQVTEVEDKPKEQYETAEKVDKEFEGVELEKTEQVEVLPVKESETVVAKDTEDSEVEPRKEEISKQVTEVEDKPKEQYETAEKVDKEFEGVVPKEGSAGKVEDPLLKEEQTDKEERVVTNKPLELAEVPENFEEEYAEVEPKETVKVEIAKDEEASAGKVEDPVLKEEQTDKEKLVVTDEAQERSEATEKIEEDYVGFEKGMAKIKIEKGGESSAGKIGDPLLKEEQTDKEEPVAIDKPQEQEEPVVIDKSQEQSETAEKVEEEYGGIEPKELAKVEIEKDGEDLVGKIEDPFLKDEQTDKEDPVVTDKPQEKSEAAEGTEPKEIAGKIEDPLFEELTNKEEPVVMDKPLEQSEAVEKVEEELAGVEPKETAKVELAKYEEALAGKIEDPLFKEELTNKEEPVVVDKLREQSEAVEKVEEQHAGVEPNETAEVEIAKNEEALDGKIQDSLLKEGLTNQEKPVFTDKPQDQFEVAEKIEENYAGIEPEGLKVELESEGKSVKTEEESEEKKFITEESDEPKTNKVEDIHSSISPTDVTEKSLEVEKTSRNIELDAESGKQSTNDESVTPIKSEKNGEVEGKVDEGEETVQTSETNLEKEKESDEIAKPDIAALEPTKEVDEDKKTSPELRKEEVPTKPSKQSSTLISKVKQSLVKAKKAILGKSPNSKTVLSETKGDVKDK